MDGPGDEPREAEDRRTVKAAMIYTRVREEIARRQGDLEDPHLTALTIVVKMDRKTGLPGAIIWRPEFFSGQAD